VKPARKLLIVTSRYPFGSQEAYLNTELAELAPYFERVVVAPMRTPSSPARHAVPKGVEVLSWPLADVRVGGRAARALALHPGRVLRAFSQTLRSHSPGRTKNLAAMPKALALAAWAEANGIDHIHAYWISTPATVAMIAAGIAGIPWSATAHRWDIYEENAFDLKQRSAAFVRTISARGTADLARRMPGLADRILELRLGTVVSEFPAAGAAGDGRFEIVCPAALVPVKGHEYLLEALATLRSWNVDVRCTLCGVGPLEDRLRERVRQLQLDDAVEFAGFVPQATLHGWYRAGRFQAVVLASRNDGDTAMEGLPSALIEAVAFGVPVVATDSGSVGELLDAGRGCLVRPSDAMALARALREVYCNPYVARARAEHAHRHVASVHDVSVQMRRLASELTGKESHK